MITDHAAIPDDIWCAEVGCGQLVTSHEAGSYQEFTAAWDRSAARAVSKAADEWGREARIVRLRYDHKLRGREEVAGNELGDRVREQIEVSTALYRTTPRRDDEPLLSPFEVARGFAVHLLTNPIIQYGVKWP